MSHIFIWMKQHLNSIGYLKATKGKSSLPAVNICLSASKGSHCGLEKSDQNIKEDFNTNL